MKLLLFLKFAVLVSGDKRMEFKEIDVGKLGFENGCRRERESYAQKTI